jgi:hypothetical protein
MSVPVKRKRQQNPEECGHEILRNSYYSQKHHQTNKNLHHHGKKPVTIAVSIHHSRHEPPISSSAAPNSECLYCYITTSGKSFNAKALQSYHFETKNVCQLSPFQRSNEHKNQTSSTQKLYDLQALVVLLCLRLCLLRIV